MSLWLALECYLQTIGLQIIYLIYMYKQDLILNNLPGLIWHKTQPTNQLVFLKSLYAIYIDFNII